MTHRPDTHETPTAAPPPLSIVALDDDTDFREYLRESLAQQGHDIRAVATPDELTSALESSTPNVILLDMKMGRYSGEAVLAELRRRWPRLCVIVVTGYPSMETMRETFKQDVFDYVAKPFSMDEMRRVLAQVAQSLGLGGTVQDRLRSALGRQIRLTRTERGWTLKELSESSGVSISQLSSIERGAHLPSMESFIAIAAGLGATPSEWFSDAGF
jgi:DNA-binding response OmpR family regulator